MAIYDLTGMICLEEEGSLPEVFIDITGTITMEGSMRGYNGPAGWDYKALIQSFSLNYGGLNITGESGELQTSNVAGDTWLTMRNEYGTVIDFHYTDSFPGLPINNEATIQTPTEWKIYSSRMNYQSLIVPLNRKIKNDMTFIKAALQTNIIPPQNLKIQ